MMYDVLYHFDGCSYTIGHKVTADNQDESTWTHIINPAVFKDGNYNEIIPLSERAGRVTFKYPYTNYAQIAKSNDAIYFDFLKNLSKFDNYKFKKVFIFWSHSERTSDISIKNNLPFVSYYKKVQHFKLKDDGNYHSYDPYEGPFWDHWMDGIVRTMYYMLSMQEICKAKNIEYNFVTTENYNLFKHVATKYGLLDVFNSINIDHIFNWPTKPLINYPNINDKLSTEDVLLYWGTTSFNLQWAKAMEGNTLIDDDKKHLTLEGHKRLGSQLMDWSLDREKDISFWIDEPYVYNKSFFYDLKSWKDEYVGIGKHWLESKVNNALINYEIKPNADYIYES